MRGFLISGKCLTFYGYLNTALSVNIEDDPLLPTDPQPKFVHHHRTVGVDTMDLHDRGHSVPEGSFGRNTHPPPRNVLAVTCQVAD